MWKEEHKLRKASAISEAENIDVEWKSESSAYLEASESRVETDVRSLISLLVLQPVVPHLEPRRFVSVLPLLF